MNTFNIFFNNKTIFATIFVAIIIFIVGLIGNNLIENKIEKWADNEGDNIKKLETIGDDVLTTVQEKLLLETDEVIKKLQLSKEPNFVNFEKALSSGINNNLAIAIFKNRDLFYWNLHYFEKLNAEDSLNFKFGETHFIESDISAYLAIRDTFNAGGNKFEIFISQLVEKQYRLNYDYFTNVSLTSHISEKMGTQFAIEFSPNGTKSKDGRKHSFDIKNNLSNRIGIATFLKPSREQSVRELKKSISTIQGLLGFIGFLLIGYVLKEKLFKQNSRLLIFCVVTIYLVAIRYILVYINFPQSLFSYELFNPKYYYSNFGFGIASSSIDLFLTLVISLLLAAFYFIQSFNFFRSSKYDQPRVKIFRIIVLIIGVIVYLLFLRGIGAAARGFVFDTSIRYFQSSSLNLSGPNILMHINVLLLGLVSILISAAIIIFILKLFKDKIQTLKLNYLFSFVMIMLVAEILFSIFQTTALLTIPIKFLQIIFVFIAIYVLVYHETKGITKLIIVYVFGSIFSISALLFYNTELEKASLKTTANIISRVDEGWYKNLISETLLSEFSRKEAVKAFGKKEANYNSSAFKIWSKSNLQNEAINSSINFISLSGELLGGFGSIYPKLSLNKFIDTNSVIEEIQIFEEPTNIENQKLIRGIFPVKDEFAFLGYLDISILSDLNDFGFSSHPEFISTGKLNEKAILKLDKLIILDYRNDELKIVYGNINPNQNFNRTILNAKFTSRNDAWMDANINGAEYVIYVKRSVVDKINRIIAIALRGKELSIGLFDFFKIFFTHSIILLTLVLGYFIIYSRKRFYTHLDLRAKLMLAFLIISVIPLILTALYFRNLTEEKNKDAIYYKLGKRAFSIENYINENYSEVVDNRMFEKASDDLNINFAVYRQNRLDYSSYDLLYDVGLIPKIINPEAYNQIIVNDSEELLVEESVDKFKFNSFYYKAGVLGDEYIIKVTDGFNKIRLPLSGSEVDVFLFGFYSLAVVLIIIFSALFANQIASPIRKLTSATKSVAAGDLSLQLEANSKGEIGELVSGFQFMIEELKKNQTILAEIEREEAWKEMAKQVAHEIKNPLTPIKLSIQQLIAAYNDKSDKFDIFFQKVTSTILNQIETLKNIATEFSNFARMPKLKVEKIECSIVIKQSINLFTDENIKINFNQNSEDNIILGDAEQLKRTIINLVRNSIQAGSTEIFLTLSNITNSCELIVEDNGKGISEENLPRIFEPNFTTKDDGMGLGLSMARRYLRSTGGDISIEKTSSQGTILKLTFPT